MVGLVSYNLLPTKPKTKMALSCVTWKLMYHVSIMHVSYVMYVWAWPIIWRGRFGCSSDYRWVLGIMGIHQPKPPKKKKLPTASKSCGQLPRHWLLISSFNSLHVLQREPSNYIHVVWISGHLIVLLEQVFG
jgi:hypothetical protein